MSWSMPFRMPKNFSMKGATDGWPPTCSRPARTRVQRCTLRCTLGIENGSTDSLVLSSILRTPHCAGLQGLPLAVVGSC